MHLILNNSSLLKKVFCRFEKIRYFAIIQIRKKHLYIMVLEMKETIFQIFNFCVKDRDYEILKNITLDIKDEEVFAILGQDGSSKNAFLYGLMGLLPAKGSLSLRGLSVDFDLQSLKKHGIEIVWEKPKLISTMTVAENLLLDTNWEKEAPIFWNKRKTTMIAQELLKLFNINLESNIKVYNLTLEEKKNLAFVKAFSLNPDVVILHEPSENISLTSLKNLHSMVKRHKSKGKSVIYITKHWEDALRIADRIAILNEGEITEILTSEEVKNNPKKLINKIIGVNLNENASSFNENQLIDSIFEATEFLISEYELNDILNFLAENTAKATRADACEISLIDEETSTIIDKSIYKNSKNIEFIPNEAEILKLIDEEKVYYFTKRDKGFERFFKLNNDICSLICVPFYIRSRLGGIIQIYYKDYHLYAEEEIKYLETIAHQTALAIHNTKLMGNSVLLRESHHRIKNNLQSIISLISLYKTSVKRGSQKDIIGMLDDLISKIKSISAVHDLLAKDKLGRSIINLKELITHIIECMINTKKGVEFNLQLDDVFVSYSKASTIALVVNELVTNSLKYAFIGREKGEVKISCKYCNETIILEISDNGIGFPEHFDINQCKGLGLSIVHSIVTKQLGGTIFIKSSQGADITIEIPAKQISLNAMEEIN